jgi:S1-C subfamily serine protease
VGDVIVRLASEPIEGATQLQGLVARLRAGQSVPVEYVRGDESIVGTLSL